MQKLRKRLGRLHVKEPDHRHYLLRARRERPRRRRATEQRDELAPPDHSITSSARARILSGMVSSSVLEVLRLITNSNLTDCITGRSAGFAPLRIFAV